MDTISIISILAQNSTHPFDDAVDQLAAIAEPKLFEQAIAYAHTHLLPQLSIRDHCLMAERGFEILITAIAYATQIPASQRLELLSKLPDTNRRAIKAALIDALVVLSDKVPAEEKIKQFLEDGDRYIREYAKESLL